MAIAQETCDRTRAVTRLLGTVFALLVAACTTAGTIPTGAPASIDGEQPQQGFVVFTDIPMPADASVELDRTIVLGTGEDWMGRVTIRAKTDLVSVFDFYREQMPQFGWNELTVLRSATSVLTYTRGGRIATIQIESGTRPRSGSYIIFSVSPLRAQPQT
jgi:hypothetical protein